ncbi:MAG: GNAT family N-acetyltransferase, partial [Xanthomonadales bacterium]|nr:GNAT family N-acetyltransferase [Xanthomonadales bacterium]
MPSSPIEALQNIVWHSLTGAQSGLSVGTDRIRRYAPGYSQLIGAVDPSAPTFNDLVPFCTPDEHFYVLGWSGPAPRGWQVDVDAEVDQLVWEHAAPTALEHSDIVRLGAAHVARMIHLTGITHPGPFAERTIEFGEYYGILDGEHLLAMAGERMHAGVLREISAVCTDPNAQGRGLARRLMNLLLRIQIGRGQTPFLHVMAENTHA